VRLPKQSRGTLRIHLPIALDEDIGLGDALKKVTSALGLRPCCRCEQRAATLDRHVVFSGRADTSARPRWAVVQSARGEAGQDRSGHRR
jgi:hypothetical protein